MESPFPGFDPYVVAYWRTMHFSLIAYSRDEILPLLPNDLVAMFDDRLFVEAEGRPTRSIYADVQIKENYNGAPAPGLSHEGGVAVAAAVDRTTTPDVVVLEAEPVSETIIEIREPQAGNRLVTSIEIVSPTNKRPGPGRTLYCKKQEECRAAGVSTVEIDLIRGGQHAAVIPEWALPARYIDNYLICVHRGWDNLRYELYPVSIRERMPVVRIPLRESDADVALELQKVFDMAYRNGRYFRQLDYRKESDPPLPSADAEWAAERLKSKGLRP